MLPVMSLPHPGPTCCRRSCTSWGMSATCAAAPGKNAPTLEIVARHATRHRIGFTPHDAQLSRLTLTDPTTLANQPTSRGDCGTRPAPRHAHPGVFIRQYCSE